MTTEAAQPDTRPLLEFMYRLGQAYLACGEQTAKVELLLRRVASANGVRRSRVVALPTALFITLVEPDGERVTLAEGPLQTLRLDQIAEVYTLGDAAQAGATTPADGLARLNEILRTPPRFGAAGVIIGHTVLTVGLSMVLAQAIPNLIAAAALGAIVGTIKAVHKNRPILSAPLSVVVAALVSGLVFLAVDLGLAENPLQLLIPPLITFLPGAMVTIGMVELAYGDMVSGTSRLVTGLVQLVLLAFGLAAGALVVGYGAENLVQTGVDLAAVPWEPWLGVVTFGVGVFLHFSAPRKSLGWLLLTLLATYAAQRLAYHAFGVVISGFFGSLVATPLGYLIQQRFKGPPSMVTFLPSFWLLVPGSVGLISVAHMLSDRDAGLEGMTSAVFAFASIALGTLVGASLYRWLTESLGAWRLQVGRAASRPRSAGKDRASSD